jgi:hypothetical protein
MAKGDTGLFLQPLVPGGRGREPSCRCLSGNGAGQDGPAQVSAVARNIILRMPGYHHGLGFGFGSGKGWWILVVAEYCTRRCQYSGRQSRTKLGNPGLQFDCAREKKRIVGVVIIKGGCVLTGCGKPFKPEFGSMAYKGVLFAQTLLAGKAGIHAGAAHDGQVSLLVVRQVICLDVAQQSICGCQVCETERAQDLGLARLWLTMIYALRWLADMLGAWRRT